MTTTCSYAAFDILTGEVRDQYLLLQHPKHCVASPLSLLEAVER